MTRRQISRVSPESAHTHQREAHWPTARSGWQPNVTKTRVRVYTDDYKFIDTYTSLGLNVLI